jgi:integrase
MISHPNLDPEPELPFKSGAGNALSATSTSASQPFRGWNRGRILGQKRALKPREVWAIRVRLHIARKLRDLALFNLAIDSKLRGCDLVKLRIADVIQGGAIRTRTGVIQQKTGAKVQFEITEQSREAVKTWVAKANLGRDDWLFPSRNGREKHLTTRQYARLVGEWIEGIGLPVKEYGTHSMRRTKASLIYRKTGNLRAVQLLLGHTKMDSTVRYLGIDVDDALEIAENVDI